MFNIEKKCSYFLQLVNKHNLSNENKVFYSVIVSFFPCIVCRYFVP